MVGGAGSCPSLGLESQKWEERSPVACCLHPRIATLLGCGGLWNLISEVLESRYAHSPGSLLPPQTCPVTHSSSVSSETFLWGEAGLTWEPGVGDPVESGIPSAPGVEEGSLCLLPPGPASAHPSPGCFCIFTCPLWGHSPLYSGLISPNCCLMTQGVVVFQTWGRWSAERNYL